MGVGSTFSFILPLSSEDEDSSEEKDDQLPERLSLSFSPMKMKEDESEREE
jgi:hypothetical protein